MRPGSLRTRLALIVLIATVPSILLALGAGFTHRRLLAQDARDDAVQVAEAGQDHQIQLIADTEMLLKSLAQNPIVLGDDREACSRLMADLMTNDSERSFSNLAVAQLDGLFVCSATPMTAPVNVADRVYFQRALATRRFAPGEHVIGRVSGRGTLLTGLPVLGADGAPTAVIHAGIDLTWVSRFIATTSLPAGSQVTVIDRNGLVLAQYPDGSGMVGQRVGGGPLLDLIKSGEKHDGEIVDLDGTAKIFALRPFDSRDQGNAVIYVAIPRDVALADANRTLVQDLLTVLAVALVALAAAWFGGEAFFMRRVRHLIGIAECLAGGDLSARTNREKDAGELGRLEQAFDDMAASLERRGAERDQIGKALAASEARYRTVVDQVQEVIFQVDMSGRWTFLNPAWFDITGFTVEQSLGVPFIDYIHPDDRAGARGQFAVLISQEKELCSCELRLLTAAGGYRWIEAFARLVFAPDGSVTGTAGTLMDVTERRRAASALMRQDQLLKAAATASNLLLVTPDLDAAMQDALATCGKAAEVDRLRLFEITGTLEEGSLRLALQAEWVAPEAAADALDAASSASDGLAFPVHPGGRFSRWMRELGHGRAIAGLVSELPADEQEFLTKQHVRSVLALPLIINEQLSGLLAFEDCYQDRRWAEGEMAVFETMAGAVGGAIARKRDEDAVRMARRAAERESERLLALHEASAALASPTADMRQVVAGILKSASDLIGAEAASLYRWDEEAGLLRCVHSLGVPRPDPSPDRRPGEGLAGHTYAVGAPVIVNAYQTWARATKHGVDDGLQAGIGVPLRHAGRLIGVLLIRTYREDHRHFEEQDVRLVSLFADQAAAALENVRLQQSLEQRVDRLQTMAHLTQMISSSLTMSDVLPEIAAAAARLMRVPSASLWLADEARRALRVGAVSDPSFQLGLPDPSRRYGEGGVGWVAEYQDVLRIDDVFADNRFSNADWWRTHGLRSFYGIPVLYERRLVAVLAFHGRLPFRFDVEDRELLEIFVATTAVALRNAALFERLGESNRALEVSVERANALAEQAQTADRAKSEFLSRVSHELRTPLNAILGFAQVLEMRALSAQDQESVRHIMKGGHHLLGLINEVLDISRIESGTLHLSLEAVDGSEVVAEVLDLVRPMADAVGVSLASGIGAGDHPWVFADRQRLKQVLLNIVTNAVKYNRQGGSVTVGCDPALDERVRFVVSDTGRGIPRSKIDRLFDPFDRLGAEGSSIEGTGLGLTISRALAEAMGGTLTADSTVGVGSQFTVELPGSTPPTQAAAPRTDPVLLALAESTELRRTILYVEDNTPNRQLVEQVLAWRPSIDLLAAPTGQAGIELAQARRPDLVLLDLHLPDMHGRDVLGSLRSDPSNSGVPIVVLSADASPQQVQLLLDAGADAFLTKPIVVRDLLRVIDTMLERVA